MKKLSLLCLSFLLTAILFAQDSMPKQLFTSGLRVGGNYSNMIFGNGFDYSSVNPKIGFNAGAVLRIDFIYNPFEIELGLLYSRKGAKVEGQNYSLQGYTDVFTLSRNYQLNYIDFPLVLNITTSNKRKWQLYAGGGIMLSMGSKGKIKDTYTSEFYELDFKSSVIWDDSPDADFFEGDLSYIGQIGFRVSKTLEFNASISQSLLNIDPNNDFVKNSTISISAIRTINRKFVGR
jgi:hypothetical protein